MTTWKKATLPEVLRALADGRVVRQVCWQGYQWYRMHEGELEQQFVLLDGRVSTRWYQDAELYLEGDSWEVESNAQPAASPACNCPRGYYAVASGEYGRCRYCEGRL